MLIWPRWYRWCIFLCVTFVACDRHSPENVDTAPHSNSSDVSSDDVGEDPLAFPIDPWELDQDPLGQSNLEGAKPTASLSQDSDGSQPADSKRSELLRLGSANYHSSSSEESLASDTEDTGSDEESSVSDQDSVVSSFEPENTSDLFLSESSMGDSVSETSTSEDVSVSESSVERSRKISSIAVLGDSTACGLFADSQVGRSLDPGHHLVRSAIGLWMGMRSLKKLISSSADRYKQSDQSFDARLARLVGLPRGNVRSLASVTRSYAEQASEVPLDADVVVVVPSERTFCQGAGEALLSDFSKTLDILEKRAPNAVLTVLPVRDVTQAYEKFPSKHETLSVMGVSITCGQMRDSKGLSARLSHPQCPLISSGRRSVLEHRSDLMALNKSLSRLVHQPASQVRLWVGDLEGFELTKEKTACDCFHLSVTGLEELAGAVVSSLRKSGFATSGKEPVSS